MNKKNCLAYAFFCLLTLLFSPAYLPAQIEKGFGGNAAGMEDLNFLDDDPVPPSVKKTNNSSKKIITKKQSKTANSGNSFPKNSKKKQPVNKKIHPEFANSTPANDGPLADILLGLSGLGLLVMLKIALTPSAVSTADATDADSVTHMEAQVQDEVTIAEPEPVLGQRRQYVDRYGSQKTEVFNGQNWVDPGTFESMQAKHTENAVWQDRQRVKIQTGDNAYDRNLREEMQERKERFAKELQAKRNENFEQYKEFKRQLHQTDLVLQNVAEINLENRERLNNMIDRFKMVADCAVSTVGTLTGPPGWAVGTTYNYASELGTAAGTVATSPNSGVVSEVGKALLRGTVNMVVTEGLNSFGAVMSQGIRSIPKGKACFYDPIPKDSLIQVAKNLSSNDSVLKNVATDMAFESVTSVSGKLKGKIASSIGWGTVSGSKAALIDPKVSGAFNDALLRPEMSD